MSIPRRPYDGIKKLIAGTFYDYENDGINPEPQYCKTFGCGHKMSLLESRYGDRCFNCRKEWIDMSVDVKKLNLAG